MKSFLLVLNKPIVGDMKISLNLNGLFFQQGRKLNPNSGVKFLYNITVKEEFLNGDVMLASKLTSCVPACNSDVDHHASKSDLGVIL